MYGYGGTILTIDVTNGQQRIEAFDAAYARKYLGGNGFAVKLCYDRIPRGIDAFDPRNLVIDHVARGLRRHVPRAEACAPGRDDQPG